MSNPYVLTDDMLQHIKANRYSTHSHVSVNINVELPANSRFQRDYISSGKRWTLVKSTDEGYSIRSFRADNIFVSNIVREGYLAELCTTYRFPYKKEAHILRAYVPLYQPEGAEFPYGGVVLRGDVSEAVFSPIESILSIAYVRGR